MCKKSLFENLPDLVVVCLLQLDANGIAIFGNRRLSTVGINNIPTPSAAGLALLVPYSMDLATRNAPGGFLSYR